jgi:hypothetical protein
MLVSQNFVSVALIRTRECRDAQVVLKKGFKDEGGKIGAAFICGAV